MPKPLELLKTYFSFSEFRPGQRAIIDSVIAGKDTLVIMPTGGGKSLCYQIPALLSEGTCLVISPLIALMKDQVDQLNSRGIKSAAINSMLSRNDYYTILNDFNSYQLIYIAPERLEQASFIEELKQKKISFLAVDEAHCISQWGHDFRPSYRYIYKLKEHFPNLATIALTATATPDVADDIVENLKLQNETRFVQGFDRTNLKWIVLYESDKLKKLKEIVEKTQGSGIVYCSSRKQVEEVASYLEENHVEHVEFYHGRLGEQQRTKAQDDFTQNQKRILVCTNAFGMGIDKPDVRFVVHYNMPADLEAYYQEAGRAGRDRRVSYCVLLYSPQDKYIHNYFIERQYPDIVLVKAVWNELKRVDDFVSVEYLKKKLVNLKEGDILAVIDYLSKNAYVEIENEILYKFIKEKDPKDDADRLKKQRQTATKRLDSMLLYAERRTCRRNSILNYFGEKHNNDQCGRCDICTGRNAGNEFKLNANHERILYIISKYDEKYGVTTHADFLLGLDNATIEKHKLYKDKNFGAFKSWQKRDMYQTFTHFIDHNYLYKTDGKFPLIALTKKSLELLFSKNSIEKN